LPSSEYATDVRRTSLYSFKANLNQELGARRLLSHGISDDCATLINSVLTTHHDPIRARRN
jgi:hypothetical protein